MKYDLCLIPMSAKPFHAGHYYLVQKAAAECSRVKLFVGTGNRNKGGTAKITGEKMLYLWKNFYEPYMPNKENIEFIYEGVPVRNVYEELDEIKSNNVNISIAVYSGKEIDKKGKTLVQNRYQRLINDPYWNNTLTFVEVERGEGESPDVSGTDMRRALTYYDSLKFIAGLPYYLNDRQKLDIFNILLK